MKTPQPTSTLRSAIERLQPLVDRLREVERDAEGILRQLEAIPTACHEGPEVLLEQPQKRVDQRFCAVVGSPPPASFISPDRPRDLLRLIEQLARLSGAGADVSPLPMQPAFSVWTDNESLYEDVSRLSVVGGVHPLPKLKFSPGRELELSDDGSLQA